LSLERAQHIGASCTQIFVSPPQQWVQTNHSQEEIDLYKQKQQELGIGPNFIHGTYLINLAAESPEHVQKSIDWLIYAQTMADKLGVAGTIFHIGSHKGRGFDAVFDQLVSSIRKVLEKSPQNPFLILENSAGGGGSIGCVLPELGRLIKTINDPRLKVCIDTQHAFASGCDLEEPETFLAELEREVGLSNLVVLHVNDSKTTKGSKRDRHENLGEGYIGKENLQNLFRSLAKVEECKDLPLILEVPGFADKGPDKENIDILRNLTDELR
jgi:deoxyribonuclease IV